MKNKQELKVYFVLASLPNYSETFLRSLFEGLGEKKIRATVFLQQRAEGQEKFAYVNPFPIRWPALYFFFPSVITYLLLTKFSSVYSFFSAEQMNGSSLLKILKRIYINAHIFLAPKPDWIHFGFATLAVGNENLAKALGARLAVSIRGFDIALYPLKHKNCYQHLWARVDKLHTISDDLYDLAVQQGFPLDKPFRKIRPAIRVEKLITKTYHELSSPIQIVSVGRLVWKKGFEYAISAIHILKTRGYSVRYSIIGSGIMEDQLLYAIRDLDLINEVSLIGKVEHLRVFEILSESDIYIQPSIQEGFCNALLEAQGSGLLCICTDAEGLQENVIDGLTGWVVPKRNSIQLANAIERIIKLKSEERKVISQQAISRVRTEFNLGRLLDEFEMFYSEA